MKPSYIDVLRHGEPEGNPEDGSTVLRGSTDHPLTDKGWLQVRKRCGDISASGCEWDVVISSPLVRCADFARELVEKEGIQSLEVNPQWREIHYGDWENKSTKHIWQQQPELMAKMWQQPLDFCAPNGEAVRDFSERIKQAWLELITQHQGKRILLICHGGVMRVLLQQLLLLAPEGMNRFAIPYAAMSRFRVDYGDDFKTDKEQAWPSLISHLGDELVR